MCFFHAQLIVPRRQTATSLEAKPKDKVEIFRNLVARGSVNNWPINQANELAAASSTDRETASSLAELALISEPTMASTALLPQDKLSDMRNEALKDNTNSQVPRNCASIS